MRIELRVNGGTHTVDVDPKTSLLFVLQNDLELNGPKFGCGMAQCGACTVIIDRKAVRSCVLPVSAARGKAIITLEGLGSGGSLHPIQQAFIDTQAAQCGYCISGMIMTAKAFLDENRRPTEEQARHALSGNLCRCGTHLEILDALKRAAGNEWAYASEQIPQGSADRGRT